MGYIFANESHLALLIRREAITYEFISKTGFTINQFILFMKMPGRFKMRSGVAVNNKRIASRQRQFLINSILIFLIGQNSIGKSNYDEEN